MLLKSSAFIKSLNIVSE